MSSSDSKETVKLVPFSKDFLDAIVRWNNDSEITRFVWAFRPYTREMAEAWYAKHQEDADQFDFGIKVGDKLIGDCGINVDWRNRSCHAQLTIGEKYHQGKGYGTKISTNLVEYCFNTLNLHRIELTIIAFNERSLNIARNLGFTEEGWRRHTIYHEGQYHDVVIMGLLKAEWDERKNTLKGKK